MRNMQLIEAMLFAGIKWKIKVRNTVFDIVL